jgi:hypothetical protein
LSLRFVIEDETVQAQWGYFGCFSDADGNLWKVAVGL